MDGNQFEALPAEVRQDMQQRIDAARRMFAEKVAMFTVLSVDAVTGTAVSYTHLDVYKRQGYLCVCR